MHHTYKNDSETHPDNQITTPKRLLKEDINFKRKESLDILIVLPFQNSNNSGYYLPKRHMDILPPLSIACLASMVSNNHRLTLVDERVDKLPHKEYFDIVAISTLTAHAFRAYEIAQNFRKKGAAVVMGGVHVTLNQREALKFCDAICVGEAEPVFKKIITDVQNGKLKRIYNGTQADLKDLPVPAFSKLNIDRYSKISSWNKGPVIPIAYSRGCFYNCDFCCVPEIFGKKIRYRPVNDVIREIKYHNVKYYRFIDDNFFSDPEKTKELLVHMLPLKKKFHCFVDTQSYKYTSLIKLAKKAGCSSVQVGIESFNQDALTSVNKDHYDINDYKQLVKAYSSMGIITYASVMIGFANDTPERIKDTIDNLLDCGFKDAKISMIIPYPGTRFFRKMKEKGKISCTDWRMYQETYPIIAPDNMNKEEFESLYWKSYRKYYSYTNIMRRLLLPPYRSIFNHLIRSIAIRKSLCKKVSKMQGNSI